MINGEAMIADLVAAVQKRMHDPAWKGEPIKVTYLDKYAPGRYFIATLDIREYASSDAEALLK
jgi:hypothetical protein